VLVYFPALIHFLVCDVATSIVLLLLVKAQHEIVHNLALCFTKFQFYYFNVCTCLPNISSHEVFWPKYGTHLSPSFILTQPHNLVNVTNYEGYHYVAFYFLMQFSQV
jgi:hypothetical protein